MDDESGMMTEMSWEVDEEVNQDKNGEADGMNLESAPSYTRRDFNQVS